MKAQEKVRSIAVPRAVGRPPTDAFRDETRRPTSARARKHTLIILADGFAVQFLIFRNGSFFAVHDSSVTVQMNGLIDCKTGEREKEERLTDRMMILMRSTRMNRTRNRRNGR